MKQVTEEQHQADRSQEKEDGSVDIDFDPAAASPEGGDEHYANLAEFLPDDVLERLGQTFLKNIKTIKCVEKNGNNLTLKV